METLRTLKVTNGTETRELAVVRFGETIKLWDVELDHNCDGFLTLPDDSDESVADAIRENGFEIGGEE